ncbi:hypothetical protein MVLG_01938 [Microbotryum lychnidis-dioicae p1A1 Lamole]|uniref:Ima1 N-terminal domain-containing protein n=1 Tax=Microbotryum lychnidis-dioicae (strain p1A1 Lamole / MvSl-1064) TaxID=683840 RepID=U5H3M7_USTV1|nr:hypothetical protein MVLG_01938 [Microbotryum lychnidis-dioicae p1A1 Lamole]|eukprot:KDE07844.1 hypothetical protein MVLG_01938 [Microbotryum lychnidis-dioicae p1A1 Lamole]
MVWPWPSNHEGRLAVVGCHFCATKLDLVNANYDDARGNGKGKAVAYDRPVAVGTRRDWICGYCACRNHFDQNGVIISDEPAHHDPQLNLESFSRRATPTKSRITSSTPEKQSPFCRSCLSNQSLQIHLLASYDLDSDHPVASTSSTPTSVSNYRQSLDRRYPIVCSTCLPSVESIIKQRDYWTKTSLFGSRLRESQRAACKTGDKPTKRLSFSTIIVWRVRGVLWYSIWISSVLTNAWALWDSTVSSKPCPLPVVLLLASSLLWINWDPTWLRLYRTKVLKRRRIRIQGRKLYISLQMLAYTHRLAFALWHHLKPASIVPPLYATSLALQVVFFIISLYAIRLVPRAQVRIGSSRPVILPTSPAATLTPDPLEPIESLSISSDLPALFPIHPQYPQSTPNANPGSKLPLFSTTLLRHRLQPEPKFGQPWIQASPTSLYQHPNDQDGDIEMSDAEPDPETVTEAKRWNGKRGEVIEFGKSKVRWGWNEPSSGLDEVFEERMRVDDEASPVGGEKEHSLDAKTEGRWRWLRWFGG